MKKKKSPVLSVLFIFIISILITLFQILMQVAEYDVFMGYFRTPLLFFFNFLPIFLALTLLYFVSNSVFISYAITSSVFYLFLVINHYKIFFRDEPFSPNDLTLARDMFGIMKNYQIEISWRVVVIGLAFLLLGVFVKLFLKSEKARWYTRTIAVGVVVIISCLSIKYIYHNEQLYYSLTVNENTYNDVSVNNSRGFIYNFLYKTTGTYYQKPEGYLRNNIDEILDNYGKEFSNSQDAPNVIAIMSEAFFDVSLAKDIEYYYGKNPMTQFNTLKKNALYGSLIVPGFAGGTSSTEFEFLSGSNLSLIDKSLPTVYRTHITKNMYCIPMMFKEMGYTNIAIHPGDKWFYNRQNVYKRMGFDKFITSEDLPKDTEKVNWYVSDAVTGDLIIEEYKNHLKENPDTPYFNFTVSIQNHGPYVWDKIEKQPRMKPVKGMSDTTYNIINNYLNGIYDAVNMLKRVVDYTNTIDKPTVVVFFGDHLPHLDTDFLGYGQIGYDIYGDTIEHELNKHRVPFLVLGNNAYLKDNKPSVKGNIGNISSNFLSMLMLKYMNIDLPPFFDFVDNLFAELQVITPSYFISNGQNGQLYDDKQLNLINQYKHLQYFNMKEY
ncbi:MAG: LTA synthase family protein [Clostridia bacterium]|nr:LTA synthase family protein [Clostridia bacterium]